MATYKVNIPAGSLWSKKKAAMNIDYLSGLLMAKGFS